MNRPRTASARLNDRIQDVERRLRELRRARKILERGGAPPVLAPRSAAVAPGEGADAARNAGESTADRRTAPYASEEERRRFARYLPSAGFDAGGGARASGRVRRNQILLSAIAIAFVLFILYRAVF